MSLPSKALSLTPWWAWLVVNGYKPVENRTWPTNFRGPFAIHASIGKRRDYDAAKRFLDAARSGELADRFGGCSYGVIPDVLPEDVPRGAIVGVARLDRCLPFDEYAARGDLTPPFVPSLYAFGPYVLELSGVRSVEPIPCKGALGFWRIPEGVEASQR